MDNCTRITLGLIQNSCGPDQVENYTKTLACIRTAAQRGANIICTQELFKTPYFCQTENPEFFKLAEEINENNPTLAELSALAGELQVVIIASLFEKRAKGLHHNAAVVFDADGRLLGIYRKMHIPDDPQYQEKYYFTPGDQGYHVFKTRYATIGVLICWDQWFPEAARITALQGADILFYPSAIGWLPADKAAYGLSQHDAWETIQRSHAVANGCYVASINRVGIETQLPGQQTIAFWGQSFVAGPLGQLLAKASSTEEEILVVPIDLKDIETTRVNWPFFRDRRVSSYSDITKKYIDT